MRRTHFTVLAVCEGYAEDQLACTVRDLYLARNCGTTLQRRNAHGYGGAHALEVALDLKESTEYDRYAVLVDTDRHWGEAERALAARHGIVAIEHRPCLEAMLLAVDRQPARASTRDYKAAFRERYGDDASRDGLIARHFTREMFDGARDRVEALDRLLGLIRQ